MEFLIVNLPLFIAVTIYLLVIGIVPAIFNRVLILEGIKPQFKFDNNDIVKLLVGGWFIVPICCIYIVFALSFIIIKKWFNLVKRFGGIDGDTNM
jgi:uncharacterized membrane protein